MISGDVPPGTRNARTGLPVGKSSAGNQPPTTGGCALILLTAVAWGLAIAVCIGAVLA